MSIAILDYDMANLRSVQKGFEKHGHGAVIVRRPEELKKFDKLVLPGVGAFKDAVGTLRERGLVEPILEHIGSGRPLLGICLGLQILFETGLEDGEHAGLGVFGGVSRRFDVDTRLGLKVPHMGWNTLDVVRRSPLMEGLTGEVSVYFVHGYQVEPTDLALIATTTDYGGAFVSSIWKDNVMAVQFHPEKSQAVGLGMLARFAEYRP